MAKTLELESGSDTKVPSSFNVSTSLGVSDAMQSKRSSSSSSVFSRMHNFLIIQSHIRELVTGPSSHYTPSSAVHILNICTAALSALRFSSLIQSCNIGGHSAIYWAIVNNRQEVLSAFMPFMSRLSSRCRSELRQACMVTSNHALFAMLNLRHSTGPEHNSLKRLLGCPPDGIAVCKGSSNEHHFVVKFRFNMFQRRLHMTRSITSAEFVAGGRIWWMRIAMMPQTGWCMEWGLHGHSLPVRPRMVIIFKPQRSKRGCASPKELRSKIWSSAPTYLVPRGYRKSDYECPYVQYSMSIPLNDRVIDQNSPYMDDEGTLRVMVEVTLD